MTDYKKFLYYISCAVVVLPHNLDDVDGWLELADEVLRKNQNGPPDGGGDGSFDAPSWNNAKKLLNGFSILVEAAREV